MASLSLADQCVSASASVPVSQQTPGLIGGKSPLLAQHLDLMSGTMLDQRGSQLVNHAPGSC